MSDTFIGVFFVSLGGLAAGSFYVPYRKIQQWSWESVWLVQSVFAGIVMPWLVGGLTVPRLWTVFTSSSVQSVLIVYFFGMLWGIGSLTFGLSLRYLGLSLGYALSLGCCAVVGTLAPPLIDGKLFLMFQSVSGLTVISGVAVCVAGVAICGRAGIRRESKESKLARSQETDATRQNFDLVKGFAVAICAGVLSACMALGMNAGRPIAQVAVHAGVRSVYQNNPVLILLMAGGFTTNCLWCLWRNMRDGSIRDYVRGTGRLLAANYLLAGLAGAIGYTQFFFYGIGSTQMGSYNFSSWTILMASIIVFSNLWGMYFGEWKGVDRRTVLLIWSGLVVLTLSTIVIGQGNYLAGG